MRCIKKLSLLILLGSVLALSGCAVSTIRSGLSSYPDEVSGVKNNLQNSQYAKAIQQAQDLNSKPNAQLSGLELGRSYQLSGDYAKSQAAYDQVLAQVRVNQEQAKIEVGRLLAQTGSLFVNPQMVPYRLAPYEVVYLLGYEALDQIALNNPANALVYLRQAYDEQTYIQAQQSKELLEADKKAKKESWSFNPKDHPKEFSATLNAASHIKNGFENAWIYYLTALTYFSQGDDNNAFVAIKKTLALAPENPAVRDLLLNILIDRGGDQTQLNQYLSNFGLASPPSISKNSGLVVILYEQNWVPAMSTVSIPIPLGFIGGGTPQIQYISLPVYASPDISITPLSIKISQASSANPIFQTANLMNVYDLAAKNLMDRYPLIVAQAVLSFIAKASVTEGFADSQGSNSAAGSLIAIAGSIYGALTSNADCRSWLTLPANEQVWEGDIPSGTQIFNLTSLGRTESISVPVDSSSISLIWVVQAGGLMQAKLFKLPRV